VGGGVRSWWMEWGEAAAAADDMNRERGRAGD